MTTLLIQTQSIPLSLCCWKWQMPSLLQISGQLLSSSLTDCDKLRFYASFLESEDLLADGWTLYSQRLDKGWGLTNCTSFVVMLSEQISQAFIRCRHFEQAGFVKLL